MMIPAPAQPCVLPLFYLAPWPYYRYLLSGERVVIDTHEHYVRQSYRTRCEIMSPQGRLDLVIPVHGRRGGTVQDTRIDYSENWQQKHWRSLVNFYRTSAFFEFYETHFQSVYSRKVELLSEWNLELLDLSCKLLKQPVAYELSTSYMEPETGITDLRGYFNPHNREEWNRKEQVYFQVYQDKAGFKPGISIADILFNLGPQAIKFIK
jgi:hypothetical protein